MSCHTFLGTSVFHGGQDTAFSPCSEQEGWRCCQTLHSVQVDFSQCSSVLRTENVRNLFCGFNRLSWQSKHVSLSFQQYTAGLIDHQLLFNTLLRFKVSKPTSVHLSSVVKISSLLLSVCLPPSQRRSSQHCVYQSRWVSAILSVPPKITVFFMQCHNFLDLCLAWGFRCYCVLCSALRCLTSYSPRLILYT